MNIREAIYNRRSVRKFKDQIISDEINNSESVYSSLQSVYNNISVESLRVFNKYKNSLHCYYFFITVTNYITFQQQLQ